MRNMYSDPDSVDAILDLLPAHTNKYPYDSFHEFSSILRSEANRLQDPSLDAPSQFVLFTGLSSQTFAHDFEQPIRGIICNIIDSYHPHQEALSIKMKAGAHEAAHLAINGLLIEKLTGMSLAHRGLVPTGQKTTSSSSRSKEADLSYRPLRLPHGRSKQWPTLVAESGYSASARILEDNAKWWFSASGGDVQIVITIDVHRKWREINIKLYEHLDDGTINKQHVTVSKPPRCPHCPGRKWSSCRGFPSPIFQNASWGRSRYRAHGRRYAPSGRGYLGRSVLKGPLRVSSYCEEAVTTKSETALPFIVHCQRIVITEIPYLEKKAS